MVLNAASGRRDLAGLGEIAERRRRFWCVGVRRCTMWSRTLVAPMSAAGGRPHFPPPRMQFVATVYIDPKLMAELPEGEFDSMMRDCIAHADELQRKGKLYGSRMLTEAPTARTIRTRAGSQIVLDGPFAEAKEMLGGFNIIEAADFDEALEIASHFPWHRVGSIEVRACADFDAVREKVGAPCAPVSAPTSLGVG